MFGCKANGFAGSNPFHFFLFSSSGLWTLPSELICILKWMWLTSVPVWMPQTHSVLTLSHSPSTLWDFCNNSPLYKSQSIEREVTDPVDPVHELAVERVTGTWRWPTILWEVRIVVTFVPRAELDAPYFSGTGGALFWHLRNTILIFGHTHMA